VEILRAVLSQSEREFSTEQYLREKFPLDLVFYVLLLGELEVGNLVEEVYSYLLENFKSRVVEITRPLTYVEMQRVQWRPECLDPCITIRYRSLEYRVEEGNYPLLYHAIFNADEKLQLLLGIKPGGLLFSLQGEAVYPGYEEVSGEGEFRILRFLGH